MTEAIRESSSTGSLVRVASILETNPGDSPRSAHALMHEVVENSLLSRSSSMSQRDRIRVVVMGTLRQGGLAPAAQAIAERHGISIEVEQLDAAGADPGTLMDLLEVLQKTGYSVVELRDPATQVLTPLTEWTASANEAGLVDALRFRESDFGFPAGYNLSYLATQRLLRETDIDVEARSFALLGDSVSIHGVEAALTQSGADQVRITTKASQVPFRETTSTGTLMRTLDFRHGGGTGLEGLDAGTADPTADTFRKLFWAERLRQVVQISVGQDLPFSFSRELSEC